MVLVDTSVWIRFLRQIEPYASGLEALLNRDEAVGHPFVFGELALGARPGREGLLRDYELMEQALVVPHSEVIAFVRHRRLYDLGVGWIDVHLLASALVEGTPLWSADLSLARLARDLGLAYRLPRRDQSD